MLFLKYKFERHIGLYPTAFDQDCVKYCNKRLTNLDSPIL